MTKRQKKTLARILGSGALLLALQLAGLLWLALRL